MQINSNNYSFRIISMTHVEAICRANIPVGIDLKNVREGQRLRPELTRPLKHFTICNLIHTARDIP